MVEPHREVVMAGGQVWLHASQMAAAGCRGPGPRQIAQTLGNAEKVKLAA